MSDEIDALKQAEKERLYDLEPEPVAKSESAPVNTCGHAFGLRPWLWGILFIGLGLMWWLGGGIPFNWWAIFLLAPGLASLGEAIQMQQQAGRLTGAAYQKLVWGVILAALGLLWLFGFSLTLVWPLLLIGLGIKALFRLVEVW